MKEFIELFKIFHEAGLLTTSFIMGVLAIFVAIIGTTDIKTISLTRRRSIVLAVFGSILILFAASGYLLTQKTNSSTEHTTRSELDALFGAGNWFCFPDREDGVGVKKLPPRFTVGPLLRHVDTYLGRYGVGQITPTAGATVELRYPLPQTDCPPRQLAALATWRSERVNDQAHLTQARVNQLLGSGNWQCLDEYPYAVSVTRLENDLPVAYPITFVTHYDSTGFGVGEVVPGGGAATVWLAGTVARNQCASQSVSQPDIPQTMSHCFASDWEGCWRFDDSAQTMTWIGPATNSFDIGQDGVALTKIRSGYTAVVSISTPGIIETCIGSINGQPFSGSCPIVYELEPGQYQIISPGPSGGFRIRSEHTRNQALHHYNAIYQQQGWCTLWQRLVRDGLVEGPCPQAVNSLVKENVLDDMGTSHNLITGIQITSNSEITVRYPACINYGIDGNYATLVDGRIQPWTTNSQVATDVTILPNSIFSLYLRCDHMVWQ
jgi:hypothetical protein